MRAGIVRRGRQLVLLLWAAALLGAVALVGGPYLNDRSINEDPGRALATVTGVSRVRTTVDFRDEQQGIYHSPPTGLLYPTGLGEGQRVWVTYAKGNPELVKVEGREWTLSVIPAFSVALVATVIAAVLWWAIGRVTRPRPGSPEVRPTLT